MLLASQAGARAQFTLSADSITTPNPSGEGSTIRVELQFAGKNGRTVLVSKKSPVADAASYEIRKVDGSEAPLKFSKIEAKWDSGNTGLITLTPAAALQAADYSVKLNGQWTLLSQDGAPLGVYKNPDKLPILPGKSIQIGQGEQKRYGFQSHAEIARAGKGTAVDINLSAAGNERQYLGLDRMHWEANLKGQIGLDTKVRSVYTDSWTASAAIFGRTRIGELEDRWRIPVYLGLHTQLEGDRDFDNITGAAGASVKLETARLLSPIFNVFSKYNPLVHWDEENDQALLAPYWELGYEYASKLKDDGKGMDYGDNRAFAKLTWELPLMRHFGPDNFKVNADIDLALSGIYHLDASQFTDESKISVIFRRDTPEKNPLTFSIAYERGKTTPKFENYNALLMGFRKLF